MQRCESQHGWSSPPQAMHVTGPPPFPAPLQKLPSWQMLAMTDGPLPTGMQHGWPVPPQ